MKRTQAIRIGTAAAVLFGASAAVYNTATVDRFGQFARADWPLKVHNEADLQKQALLEPTRLAAEELPRDRDPFGGWAAGPSLAATGWFHAARWHNRWWLVTPSGHLFFSIGVNSVRPGDWTPISGWTPRFSWLPRPDALLAAAGRWNDSGYSFNFYRANLIRKYGMAWPERWREITLRRLRAWGCNTVGNWSAPELYSGNDTLPYAAAIDDYPCRDTIPFGRFYRRTMMDVFSPVWKPSMEKAAAQVTSVHRHNPRCIGYFVDNELAWGYEGFSSPETLPRAVLQQTERCPAKQAFVSWLRRRYRIIGSLNGAWRTDFSSWDELARSTQNLPEDRTLLSHDLQGLLRYFADTYYSGVSSVLRRLAPHQLYLGSRFASCPRPVIEECSHYTDVISFNVYQRALQPKAWGFVNALNRPCLIGEFHFGALDRGMLNAGRVPTRDQQDRAAAYTRYVKSVAALPAFVGVHWFEYVDEPLTGRTLDGENYNIGLVSVADVPYPELTAAMRNTNDSIYQWLSAGLPRK